MNTNQPNEFEKRLGALLDKAFANTLANAKNGTAFKYHKFNPAVPQEPEEKADELKPGTSTNISPAPSEDWDNHEGRKYAYSDFTLKFISDNKETRRRLEILENPDNKNTKEARAICAEPILDNYGTSEYRRTPLVTNQPSDEELYQSALKKAKKGVEKFDTPMKTGFSKIETKQIMGKREFW